MGRRSARLAGLLVFLGLATTAVADARAAQEGIVEIQRYTWEYQTQCQGGCILGY